MGERKKLLIHSIRKLVSLFFSSNLKNISEEREGSHEAQCAYATQDMIHSEGALVTYGRAERFEAFQ